MSFCAYVLHSRPFQERQQLLNLLVEGIGRIDGLTYLSSGKKFALSRSQLQPFQPIECQIKMGASLAKISRVEVNAPAFPLNQKQQLIGFYLNELIMRLISAQEDNSKLYRFYHQTLLALAQGIHIEPLLRGFEYQLLRETGQAPDFEFDVSGLPISVTQNYLLEPEQGFILSSSSNTYSGELILQLHSRNLSPRHGPAAKHLLQQLLKPLLGPKPLHSKQLYLQYLGVTHG